MKKLHIFFLVVLTCFTTSSAVAQESFPATHLARLDILDPHPDAGTIGGIALIAYDPEIGSTQFRVSINQPADSLYLFYRPSSSAQEEILVGAAFPEGSSTYIVTLPIIPAEFLATADSGFMWLSITNKSDHSRYVEGPIQRIVSAIAPEPSGSEVVPPVTTTNGIAHFAMSYDPGLHEINYVAWWLDLEGAATSAHIRQGEKGSEGSVVFELPLSIESNMAIGTWSQPWASALESARRGELYFEISTSAHPEGEIRGQIYPVETYTAFLEPGNEVPPVTESQASGNAYLIITAHGTEEVFNKLQGVAGQLTGPSTMAHIHAGEIGVSGPPLVTLERPTPSTIDLELAFGSAGGALNNEIVSQIRESETYVNIHTAAFPGGEVRGQLIPAATNIAPLVESVHADVQQATISAYHNSATNTISVTIEGPEIVRRIALSTVDGKIVSRTASNSTRTEIDAAGLSSGVYYLLVEGTGMYPVIIRR